MAKSSTSTKTDTNTSTDTSTKTDKRSKKERQLDDASEGNAQLLPTKKAIKRPAAKPLPRPDGTLPDVGPTDIPKRAKKRTPAKA